MYLSVYRAIYLSVLNTYVSILYPSMYAKYASILPVSQFMILYKAFHLDVSSYFHPLNTYYHEKGSQVILLKFKKKNFSNFYSLCVLLLQKEEFN